MLEPGKQIGPYEIVSLLGAGGMGEVYRTRDTRLGRTVALKILPPSVAADPVRRQRFEQEARAASALNHPNIISVFDVGSDGESSYIVSELIEGESLRDMIQRGPLTQSRAVDLSGQVADGLAAAHSAGIVHRDLKPENIMVTRDGRAKILDFGLAKQNAPAPRVKDETALLTLTSPGAILGTASYMSPEQVRGDEIDYRSDIFSLGLVLYECLVGRRCFERPTAAEVMTAILREDPPELPETVSPSLRQIVQHCLEKEPERRYHSARDLAFALRTVTISGSRPSGSLPAMPAARARRWLWPAICALLVSALAAFAIPHWLEIDPIDLAAYRFIPFANEHEAEFEPAWSPDGKSIAYVKTVAGVPQLMMRSLSSATPIQLTRGTTPVMRAFWSADSSVIYYLQRTGRGELWAISPAGGSPSRILEDLHAAAFSPDGKTLAIWRSTLRDNRIQGSLWLSSPPGAAPKPYEPAPFAVPTDVGAKQMWFSPDGASLLLLSNDVGSQVWLLPFPAGSGQPRRLFTRMPYASFWRASWMPDNRHVVFSLAAHNSDQVALWLADLKREKLRKLTASTNIEDYPSVAPDGRRLVFASINRDYDLIQIPLDGSPPRNVMADNRDTYSPSWSPDGSEIIYATDRTGVREIWIHNLRADLARPVITPADFPPGTTTDLTHPIFSPDGRRFAFVRFSTDQPATVWIAPAVGGTPIRLTPEAMRSPVWSPDGNSIAGLMSRERPWQPAVVGVGADMAPHLVPGGPTCMTPLDWSPAGDWLACESRDGIALFTRDGTRTKLLPKIGAVSLAFSRDGRILYAAGSANGHNFVKSIDIATADVRTVTDYRTDITFGGGWEHEARLSVSRDGKSLITSGLALRADLWLLEGYPLPRPSWKLWR